MYYVLHSTISLPIFDLSKQKINKHIMKTQTNIQLQIENGAATIVKKINESTQKRNFSHADLWSIQRRVKTASTKRNFN